MGFRFRQWRRNSFRVASHNDRIRVPRVETTLAGIRERFQRKACLIECGPHRVETTLGWNSRTLSA